jgi:hypothetical protein
MNLQQIKTSLQQRFADNHRLVFGMTITPNLLSYCQSWH